MNGWLRSHPIVAAIVFAVAVTCGAVAATIASRATRAIVISPRSRSSG